MRSRIPVWLLLVPAILSGGPAGRAEEDAILGTVIDGVEINLWIPAGVKVLRGAFVDPANAKVGNDAEDASANVWEETCRNLDCGHAGMILQNMNRGNRPTILQKALAAALKEFAAKSGHPEIEHVPLAFSGMSKGGGWSVSTAFRMPERAVAYANVVGWVADSKGTDAQLQVPGLFIIGSVPDDFKMLDAIPKDYDPGRQRGAPWTLALQWGAAHDWNNASALVLPYLDAMFRARLPAGARATGGPVTLKAVRLEDGWLGDRATWDSQSATIAPWAEYKGDKASAVWLPNRAIAFLWRAFESKDPPVRIGAATADGKIGLPEGKKRRMVVEAGATVVLEAVVNAGTDVRKVRFYAGDQVLGEVAQAPWKTEWKNAAPGPHGVFAMWESGSGKQGVSNPALVVVRKPAAEAPRAESSRETADSVSTAFRAAEHPFILWTRDEAAAIRKRVETEPWAKVKYEEMLKEQGLGQTFRNLFRDTVMGDDSVVEAEKKYLLKLVGKHPKDFLGDTGGGRHYDQYLDVLRYDALYDRLTAEERRALEDTFRVFINHHLHEETLTFTRTSWLPNMQWPRPMTAHLMALALRDEKLIREVFNSKGGWKYYFDDYLADGQFYFEEFGKQYSMIGEMLLWCRGLERLGLGELGYGYTGKGGATMRRHLESIVSLGYPRVDLPGGRAHYPKVTMGDAKGARLKGTPPYVFQHAIVDGVLPNGDGGETFWIAANMNGRDHENTKVDKMLTPHWFEIAHARWPDAGFDYFLAQMRGAGEDRYVPSLFWGVLPIDPAKVKPPAVPSYVARERGFALLRAEERPERYWEGDAPAVALQLATYYVHYAHDVFSLLGLYAFNRPIYLNRQVSNGYGGGCPWTDSTRGHAGVMVDNLQWMLDEAHPERDHPHWPNPIGEVPTRSAFDGLVKFVAARAVPVGGHVTLDNRQPLAVSTLTLDLRREESEVWPGVDMTRALFLTREYLFDVYQLTSKTPRVYQWHVHALGQAQVDAAWKPTTELVDKLYDLSNRQVAKRLQDPIEHDRYQLGDVHRLDAGDQPWSFTAVQTCALEDPAQSVLGRAWYDRKIGVRVTMLGAPETRVFEGKSPESRRAPGREGNKGDPSALPNEVGGVTLMVERRAPATVFVALHEPFKDGRPRIESFRRIQQTDEGVAVAVVGEAGSGIDDRLLLRFWEKYDQPLTLEGGDESFTFADHAHVRLGADKVEASGDLRAMRLKVAGRPRLLLNGQEERVAIEGGHMVFGPRP